MTKLYLSWRYCPKMPKSDLVRNPILDKSKPISIFSFSNKDVIGDLLSVDCYKYNDENGIEQPFYKLVYCTEVFNKHEYNKKGIEFPKQQVLYQTKILRNARNIYMSTVKHEINHLRGKTKFGLSFRDYSPVRYRKDLLPPIEYVPIIKVPLEEVIVVNLDGIGYTVKDLEKQGKE